MKNVYFAQELGSNLLSFDRVTGAVFSILPKENYIKILSPSNDIIGIAFKSNKLYELTTYVSENVVCSSVDASGNVTDSGNSTG